MRPAPRLVPDDRPSIADADLVARVCAGDRWAEDALYRRYARVVAGLVARLLGGPREDVEDVVHDAFVSAFEKMDRLRDRSAFRPWLMQIAVTHVRRVLRRRRLKRALGLLPSSDELSLERIASSEVSPEVRAELAVIDGVLGRLPTNERIAIARAGARWRSLAERGEYAQAFDVLGGSSGIALAAERARSVDELFALADTARLSGHAELAVDPLSRVVREHAADRRAAVAALTLGRLQLDALDAPAEACDSLERALTLDLPAHLREVALARLVEAQRRAGRGERARELAGEYLERFPDGRNAARIRAWYEGVAEETRGTPR